jgi:hypothetical protein
MGDDERVRGPVSSFVLLRIIDIYKYEYATLILAVHLIRTNSTGFPLLT